MSNKTERASAPTVMYRKGKDGKVEEQTFDHPDDVPAKDGWVDSPAKVKVKAAAGDGDKQEGAE